MIARYKVILVLGFFISGPPLFAANLEKLTDWQVIEGDAAQRQVPVVLLIDQSGCNYCERLKQDIIEPVLKRQGNHQKAIIRYISIDDDESIVDQTGTVVESHMFARRFGMEITPTVLFLDENARQLAQPLVGYSGDDFYLYYLDKAIESAQSLIDSRP